MNRTLFSASLTASLAIAAHIGPASAQTSDSGAASILTRSAADLTCSDLVAMEDESVRDLLYYVAGYAARDATTGGDGSAAEPAHALAPTGSDNATATTTTGTASGDAPSNETSGSTETATADATLTSVGGFEIDAEQALANCAAAPETKLTDILDQQAGPNN